MGTLTSSRAAPGVSVRKIHAGNFSDSVQYNSSSTTVSDSATTVLAIKVPHGTWITDIRGDHTIGAATCPVDIGITGSLSLFATAATKASAWSLKTDVLPYLVSLSDNSSGFTYITVTPTAGTATTSFKFKMTVDMRAE